LLRIERTKPFHILASLGIDDGPYLAGFKRSSRSLDQQYRVACRLQRMLPKIDVNNGAPNPVPRATRQDCLPRPATVSDRSTENLAARAILFSLEAGLHRLMYEGRSEERRVGKEGRSRWSE